MDPRCGGHECSAPFPTSGLTAPTPQLLSTSFHRGSIHCESPRVVATSLYNILLLLDKPAATDLKACLLALVWGLRSPRALVALAGASPAAVPRAGLSLCSAWFPSLPDGAVSLKHFPVNLLYVSIHLRICFQGILSKIPISLTVLC